MPGRSLPAKTLRSESTSSRLNPPCRRGWSGEEIGLEGTWRTTPKMLIWSVSLFQTYASPNAPSGQNSSSRLTQKRRTRSPALIRKSRRFPGSTTVSVPWLSDVRPAFTSRLQARQALPFKRPHMLCTHKLTPWRTSAGSSQILFCPVSRGQKNEPAIPGDGRPVR
jgi:hypothetical protein